MPVIGLSAAAAVQDPGPGIGDSLGGPFGLGLPASALEIKIEPAAELSHGMIPAADSVQERLGDPGAAAVQAAHAYPSVGRARGISVAANDFQAAFSGDFSEDEPGRKGSWLGSQFKSLRRLFFGPGDSDYWEKIGSDLFDHAVNANAARAQDEFAETTSKQDGFQAVPGADYRIERKPEMTVLQNLRKEDVRKLIERLSRMENKHSHGVTICEDQLLRLFYGLIRVDLNFVDTIPPDRWASILSNIAGLAEKEYGGPGRERDWDVLIDHMLQNAVKALHDQHSSYLSVKQGSELVASFRDGVYTGVGVHFRDGPGARTVALIAPGSGAEQAGLKEGDVVLSVNGTPLADLAVGESVKLLRGPADSNVRLEIRRKGRLLKQPIDVLRKVLPVPRAFSKMAGEGIGYVYFPQFVKKTAEQVLQDMRGLRAQGARSFILDVRENPGGLLHEAAAIAAALSKKDELIVFFKRQGQVVLKAVATVDGEFSDFPAVVLVNENSASASEILAAAMQDNRKAPAVIGGRSHGKGTEQMIFDALDGRWIKLTASRWFSPLGRGIDAQHDPVTGDAIPGTGGVLPDLSVEVLSEQAAKIAAGLVRQLFGRPLLKPFVRDLALEKAVEVLSAAKRG